MADIPETELANFRVVVGRTVLSSDQGHIRNIAAINVFPDFKKTGRGDVALLFLDQPVAAVQTAVARCSPRFPVAMSTCRRAW